jgi:MinD-like ATPase involved in chromosome partitioning or flagellar assembly
MKNKVLLAIPFEKLVETLTSPLKELGKQTESIPYLRGIVPTLLNEPETWEALIITDKMHGMNSTVEGLIELVNILETIRAEKKLTHLKIILLTDLPSRHPFFKEMISLGIYNLLNGPNLSIAELVHKLNKPNSYADVQHFLQTDPSIPWPGDFNSIGKKPVSVERQIVQAKWVEVKQREIAVLSFYPAGATFISMNLAALLAKRDKEVHVWDADLRNPALYHYFSQGNMPNVNPITVQQGNLFIHTRHPRQSEQKYRYDDYLDFYERVRSRSQHCIIDLSGGYDQPDSTYIIKQCTDVLIVFDPNVVKWIQLYDTIQQWRGSVNSEKCRWILTRYDNSSKRMLKDLENLFDIEVELALPDVAVHSYDSWLKGRPVVNQLSPQHPFVTELGNYVDRFMPATTEKRWYHRWFKS